MSGLRAVPSTQGRCGAPAHPLLPVGDPPAAGPLDQLSRARLRRLLAGFFGDLATLDAHLALFDTRAGWYAQRAIEAWDPAQPNPFFGLVRHVVRTQLPGPPPDPDLEGWLAAGRPDGWLGQMWDRLHRARYSNRPAGPTQARVGDPTDAVARLDTTLLSWPAEHLADFLTAYAVIEQVMEVRRIVLPPIDS